MTEKLYYKDAYIKSFHANVLRADKVGDNYHIVLDKTAFFPEEGGQSSDTGYIGTARVFDVKETKNEIIHITDSYVAKGEVECSLDFDIRFVKMQLHTAEHMLCGIIYQKYGFNNVGFHLGDDVVTFDIDGELDRDALDEIELIANGYVFDNRAVTTSFPTRDELPTLSYRAKLDITEGVRLVNIEGVDTCACCAPHVSYTGEIGIIKILDFMRHRGGLRITMVAGRRALLDYAVRYKTGKEIGALTSTPSLEIGEAVKAMHFSLEETKRELSETKLELARLRAEKIGDVDGNIVVYYPNMESDELRELCNNAVRRVGGILVALSGVEGDYKYVISSGSADLRQMSREINSALLGRGGGRPEMIQGSFGASLEDIKNYFK